MPDKSEQTEKPTLRRIEKARSDGRFPVSKDFVAAIQFLVFVFLLTSYGSSGLARMKETARFLLAKAFRSELTPSEILQIVHLLMWRIFAPLALAGAELMAATLATHLAITGFGFSVKLLAPTLTRLNPGKRLRELPRQNLPQLVQAVLMLPLFCAAVYAVASANLAAYLRLPFQAVQSGVGLVAASLEQLLWKAAWLFLVWGAIDLFRRKRTYTRDISMSRQEMRDESKEAEGNPQMKQRIRRLQRDMVRRQMMKQVPTATAVIVNPTHFAVALLYQMDSAAAPLVVAKGKNYMALRIRQKAVEHQVPVIENPPLAQALYQSVEIGQEIPAHLYRAVAEILAYIFKLMNRRSGR